MGAVADLSLVLTLWEMDDTEPGDLKTDLGLWDIKCWYLVWTCALMLQSEEEFDLPASVTSEIVTLNLQMMINRRVV